MTKYLEVLDIYSVIDTELAELANLSNKIKFTKTIERKIFFDKVVSIEKLFLKINSILLGTPEENIVREFNENIKHPIMSKQMSGWIKKIENNIADIYIKISDKSDINLETVNKEQLRLINTIIKVLHGDAYFVGCPRI